MTNLLDNNRIVALVTILVLAVGSISGVGTAQFVKGLDGDTLKNLLGGCIYGACKDTKITGNVTEGILAGCVFAGCKDTTITGEGQPTPNTATLIVTKEVICSAPAICGGFTPNTFNIQVTGNNPSPSSFQGSDIGTTVTLGTGKYTISETLPSGSAFDAAFAGDCQKDGSLSATGNIDASETQKCTITNTFVGT